MCTGINRLVVASGIAHVRPIFDAKKVIPCLELREQLTTLFSLICPLWAPRQSNQRGSGSQTCCLVEFTQG
jgi:hypothetical protein